MDTSGVKKCKFSGNKFCSSLPTEVRETLCAHCMVQVYPQRFKAPATYWSRDMVLLLDGMLAFLMNPDFESDERPVLDMMESGTLISSGGLLRPAFRRYQAECTRDTTVAIIDSSVARDLARRSNEFVMALWRDSDNKFQYMLEGMECRRVADVICLMLKRCRKYGIEEPTHREIAILTGYDRSLVTKTMKTITAEHPELFG